MTTMVGLWTRGLDDLTQRTADNMREAGAAKVVVYESDESSQHRSVVFEMATRQAVHLGAEIMITMPTDLIFDSYWLKHIESAFEDESGLVAASPVRMVAEDGQPPRGLEPEYIRKWRYAPSLDPLVQAWRVSWLAGADIETRYTGMGEALLADLAMQAKLQGRYVATVDRAVVGYDPSQPWLNAVAAPREAFWSMDGSHNKSLLKWRHGIALDAELTSAMQFLPLPQPWEIS